MSFIDAWHTALPDSFQKCRAAIGQTKDLDSKYGTLSAAILWPVREAGSKDEVHQAICEVCGSEEAAMPLLKVVRDWPDPLTAARELSAAVKGNLDLQAALEKVLDRFQEDLLSGDWITVNVTDSTLQGAIVNVGGKQYFYGPVVITTVQQAVQTCPTPPPPPDHFAGREQLVADLCARLQSDPPGTIEALYGIGGIGKTSLAKTIADRLYRTHNFRAVLWADVTRHPNPLAILELWARNADPNYLPPPQAPLTQIAWQVKALLEQAIAKTCIQCESPHMLVVFDDVWDDSEGAGKTATRQLREACPDGTSILLTSRSEALAIDLGARTQPLDRLQGTDAVHMLQAFLPDADADRLLALAESLGGHPLAMTLAARRIHKAANPADALAAHTADYQKRLPQGTAFADLKLDTGDTREDNLTLVLSYSYDDLDALDRERFRALGVLAPDAAVDHSILAALWAVEPDAIEAACDKLRLLSLLEADIATGSGWYRQHPLLRAYALALLTQVGEQAGVFTRYTDRVLAVVKKFDELPPENWAELTLYLPHVHAVGAGLVERIKATAVDDATLRQAQQFAKGVIRYLNFRRDKIRPLDWLEMGLASSRRLQDPRTEGLFLSKIGLAYTVVGELQQALSFYEQALPIQHAAADQSGEAETLAGIGNVQNLLGNRPKALDYYQQALTLFKAIGNAEGEANTLNAIGSAYQLTGDHAQALATIQQALPLYRAIGNRDGEAIALCTLGGVYSVMGDKREALAKYDQALVILRAVGDRYWEAGALYANGAVYADQGDRQQALAYYEQALPVFHEVGDRATESAVLTAIGGIQLVSGNARLALDYYERALPLIQAVGNPDLEAGTLVNLAFANLALGETQRALEYDQQALKLMQTAGNRDGEAGTLLAIGTIYTQQGEKQTAREYSQRALTIAHAVGNQGVEANSLVQLGVLCDDLGEKQQAIDYYKQALPLLHAGGNRPAEASTLTSLGLIYANLEDTQQAVTYLEQALALLRELGNQQSEATTLNMLGLFYTKLKNNARAIKYFEQALPLLQAQANQPMIINILSQMGMAYHQLGDRQKALAAFEQLPPLYHAAGDQNMEAGMFNVIGSLYGDLGKSQEALKAYENALPIFQALNDPTGQVTTLNNLGIVYFNGRQFQEALRCFEQALPLVKTIGDKGGEAGVLNWLGMTYNALAQPKQAVPYSTEALPLARAVGDLNGEAIALTQLGTANNTLGDLAQAATFFEQALEAIRAAGNRIGEGMMLVNIGSVYLKQRQGKKRAAEYFEQALALHRAAGDVMAQASIYYSVANCYRGAGDPDQAINALDRCIELSEQIKNVPGADAARTMKAQIDKDRNNPGLSDSENKSDKPGLWQRLLGKK